MANQKQIEKVTHLAKLEKGINDLATLMPDIAKEWDAVSNNGLLPSDVTVGSNKEVWWVCSKGHSYQKSVAKRAIRGQGCPTCRREKRSFANVHPELLIYWDWNNNFGVNPMEISYGSEKSVWWKCPKGHSYQQSVHRKSEGAGCPICAHQMISKETSLASVYPNIAKEWHPTKNSNLSPYDVFPQTHKKVWWLCPFGHEYQAKVYTRKKSGCPICDSEKRTSFPEQAIQFYLGKLFKTESRHIIGGFEADIYCPEFNIAIEYDGEYFHSSNESNVREERKNQFFIESGVLLFRVKETKQNITFDCHHTEYGYEINTTYSQDYEFIDDVVTAIVTRINERFYKKYFVDINIVRDKASIINMYAQQKGKNSFLMQKPLGAKKWDFDKNGDIDLNLLPRTSKKKYWWKCPTCGNEWYGSLDNIINSLTCKKCSRQVKAEIDMAPEIFMDSTAIFRNIFPSLQTENPDLASQWHPTKNGYFKPIHVSPKSGKRVWWLCPECGNEWSQYVKTRNNGKSARKCPVCANNQKKKNINEIDSFLDILFEEWHPTKNGGRNLIDFTPGSSAKVWWKCSKCGNEFNCSIKTRKNGGGCSVCGRKSTNVAKYKKVRNVDTDEIFESINSAAQFYRINRTSITQCVRGKSKTAGGYKWEYYSDGISN